MEIVFFKRCCENVGIDYATQYRKLLNNPTAVVVIMTTTGPDGKDYDMVGISPETNRYHGSQLNPAGPAPPDNGNFPIRTRSPSPRPTGSSDPVPR